MERNRSVFNLQVGIVSNCTDTSNNNSKNNTPGVSATLNKICEKIF